MTTSQRIDGLVDELSAALAEQDAPAVVHRLLALVRYHATLNGLTNVGPDEYSGQWWNRYKRQDLPLLVDVPDGLGRLAKWRQLYRLPNGDIFDVTGQSWSRWTRDESLIADRTMRNSITHHRYEPRLLSALIELEDAGALSLPSYSWFGQRPAADRVKDGLVRAYGGVQNSTGAELVERLRRHITECIEAHPRHAVALRAALELVTDDSIEHVTGATVAP